MVFDWADYAIILIIALSVLTGLFRGFIKELIAVSVWIIAIWVGFKYAEDVSPWLKSYVQDATVRAAASFILLLLATLLAGSLVSSILSFVLTRTPLKGTDRLLGMGFGLARGVFIVSLLIGMLNLTSLTKENDFKNSVLYARFKPISDWMFSFTPNLMSKFAVKKTDEQQQAEPEAVLDTQ